MLTTSRVRCGLAVLTLAGPLSFASPAAAQDAAAAESLFTRGLADMQAGRYDAGCPAIAESHRLDPRPGTVFTLATCEERWGHLASAVKHYGEYLAIYDRLPDDKQAAQGERPGVARAKRQSLALEAPELTLSLPPDAPAGTVVERDGQIVAAAALGVGLPIDPGEHVLTTRAPGGAVHEQRITIAKGEKRKVALEVKAAANVERRPAPEPPALENGPSRQRVAAFVAGGVGAAGLVVGFVMGGLALGQKGAVTRGCGTGIGSADPTACNAAGLDAAGKAKTTALGSTVGFIVGGAGVATGIVLLLTDRRPARPTTGARSRAISAGVLAVGPGGALVGTGGTW